MKEEGEGHSAMPYAMHVHRSLSPPLSNTKSYSLSQTRVRHKCAQGAWQYAEGRAELWSLQNHALGKKR